MNESGKTSILEALNDFNVGNSIRYSAEVIGTEKLEPEIELFFETTEFFLRNLFKERDEITEQIRFFDIEWISSKTEAEKIGTAEVFKKLYNEATNERKKSIFKFSILKDSSGFSVPDSNEILNASNIAYNFEDEFMELESDLRYIFEKYGISCESLPGFYMDKHGLDYYSKVLNDYLEGVYSRIPENITPEDNKLISKIVYLLKVLFSNIYESNTLEQMFLERLTYGSIPNFILLDMYDKNGIPDEVKKSYINNNMFIDDLSKVCNLNLKTLQNGPTHNKINHLNRANKILNEKYSPFWNQDSSKLNVDISDGNLNFMISENGTVYPISVRSAGRKWHLAFFIKTSSQFKEGVENIILIDEPGIHLHAKAQRDILNKMEETSKNTQIIYSTHSPYLINPKKLNRIRLVEKTTEMGTKVKNKAWIGTKEDSLRPILTAIGEDVSLGIRVDRKHNIVVEGISDYLYLQAFKKLIDYDLEFDMIPCLGNNVLSIVSILRGWNLEPYFIFDNDDKGRGFKKKISEDCFIPEEDIFLILDKEGTTEELFSEEDFKNFVLNDENADLKDGLKKYLEDNNKSKALISQQFLNNVDEGKISKDDLSKETLNNVNRVFDWISEKLNSSNN